MDNLHCEFSNNLISGSEKPLFHKTKRAVLFYENDQAKQKTGEKKAKQNSLILFCFFVFLVSPPSYL